MLSAEATDKVATFNFTLVLQNAHLSTSFSNIFRFYNTQWTVKFFGSK